MCSQEQSLSSSTNAALSNLARDPPLIFSRIYAEIADPCASANLETRRVFFSYKIITLLQRPSVIMVYGKRGCPFLLDPSQGRERVYKWKFCPFACPSVRQSDDSHAPPHHSPVNWSPNEQDHLADLSSPI